MKIKSLLLMLFCCIAVNAQVSTTRINEFRLGMKKSELEKIVGKTISVKLNEGYPMETSHVVYKGIVYEVNFSKAYDDNGNELKDFTIYSVTSQDRTLKTLSGISIGSSFDEVLNKYKNNNISIYDSWTENSTRDKSTRLFSINDDEAGTQLILTIKNGRVSEFYVSYNEGC
ncbi:MAG TPA: hypothetical protein VIG94_04050 [Faecalibacter sp.]